METWIRIKNEMLSCQGVKNLLAEYLRIWYQKVRGAIIILFSKYIQEMQPVSCSTTRAKDVYE
jgi:hypothetical protein